MTIKRLTLSFLVYLVVAMVPSRLAAQDNPLLGLWTTEDKQGVVEFYTCQDHYCGRFYWLKEDSAENPSVDDKNPDPALKKRPLCGMKFLGGFTDTGNGVYEDGWIYSPRHGSMFSSRLTLGEDGTLELRGYVLFSVARR